MVATAPAEMAVDEVDKDEGGRETSESHREVKVVSAHRALETAEWKLEKATKQLMWHQDRLEEAKEQHIMATERLQDAKATWNRAVAAKKKQSSMERWEECLAAEADWPAPLQNSIRECLEAVAKQRALDAAARKAEEEQERDAEEEEEERKRQEEAGQQGVENMDPNGYEEYINAVWRGDQDFGDDAFPAEAGADDESRDHEDPRGRSRSPIREGAAGKGKGKGTTGGKKDRASNQQRERSESEKRRMEERIKRTMAESEQEVAKRSRRKGKTSP